MCGIAGLLAGGPEGDAALRRMTATLAHRGPDGAGQWQGNGISLGHRRLAILDPSPAGAQPMLSANGRFAIVFNGEIYNHLDLRDALAAAGGAPVWRGHADTETILALAAQGDVPACLRALDGMFALALWDRQTGTLWLARDRLGEKPLYFGWVGGTFAFASELKAMQALPGFDNRICDRALAEYLRHGHVPAPFSIWRGVFKLQPGAVLQLRGPVPAIPDQTPQIGVTTGSLSIDSYWTLSGAILQARQQPLDDDAAAIDETERVLSRAVKAQMLSDVPLGAFLSGGVDSSTVAALMQRASDRPITTFTAAFDDGAFDESPDAARVAAHLGTDHRTLRVTEAEARAIIPDLPKIYDEPFADSSQIPTFLISRLARRHVTVALSGDGADELFGGYVRYLWGPRIMRRVSPWPMRLRRGAARVARGLPTGLQAVADLTGGRNPRGIANLDAKLGKLAAILADAGDIDELYAILTARQFDPEALMRAVPGAAFAAADAPAGLTDAERLMFRDCMAYLPDDILCKVDRAAMANSLETRAPFLGRDVIALSWRLPERMKLRDGVGKWALRQVLYRHVPQAMIDRPKRGFAVPLGRWLRTDLRDWAEDLLSPARLARDGLLDPAPIRQLWAAHLAEKADHSARLWTILMLQAWLDRHRAVAA